jgi:hypothetical protein
LVLKPAGSSEFWLTLAALIALASMHAVFWLVTQPVNRFWLAGEVLDPASERFFGAREAFNSKRRRLCRANALATSAALLQERESDDRKAVPHALDFRRAFTEKAGTLGGESKPRAGVFGDPATERHLENATAAAEPVTFSSWKAPALRVYDARVSTTSNFCLPGTRCSRAAPRQKVRATPWWCASARPGAAMNDKCTGRATRLKASAT